MCHEVGNGVCGGVCLGTTTPTITSYSLIASKHEVKTVETTYVRFQTTRISTVVCFDREPGVEENIPSPLRFLPERNPSHSVSQHVVSISSAFQTTLKELVGA